MLLLTMATALAMSDPWDCSVPADLQEMKAIDFADPQDVWDRAWDEAYAWVDASCVVACTADPYVYMDACIEASCVTGAGAEIEYHSDNDTNSYDGERDETTTRWLVVRLPAGAASWTEIDLRWDEEASTWGESSSVVWTASWVGTLDAAWPADEAVSVTESGGSWEAGGSGASGWSRAFAGTACAWTEATSEGFGNYCMPGWGDNESRTMNAVSGSVTWEPCSDYCTYGTYRGTWNGADVGTHDNTDWTPTGSTDADGDGFFAEDDDCDDADPAMHPCADEDPTNGIDDNCDGWSDADSDSDGHDAIAYGGDDCNDTAEQINPDIAELPCDGVDQDCDGADYCPPEDTGDTAEPDTDTVDTDTAGPEDSGGGEGSPRPRERDDGDGCGGGGAALGFLALIALRKRRAR